MLKTIYEPKNKIQKVFKRTIDTFIRKEQEAIIDDSFRENDGKIHHFTIQWSLEVIGQFPYCFHDNKSVNVDSTLYDVLVNGQTDYGCYKSLNILINEAIEKHGYYLEYSGQGVFFFVKN